MNMVVNICMVMLAVSVSLTMLRLALGPTVFDRILAFDNIAVSIVGMVGVLSIKWKTGDYLDIILLFSVLGFVSTVAFCLFLHRVYRPHGSVANYVGEDRRIKVERRKPGRKAVTRRKK